MSFEEIQYDNFLDFYHDMLPDGKWGKKLDGFVFRGESTEDYKLLPAALRKSFYDYNCSGMYYPNDKLPFDKICENIQVTNELNLLIKFYDKANKCGLKLPIIHDFLSCSENNFGNMLRAWIKYSRWIPKELVELIALAQHHGIPTRLLDWTLDINIALYFASLNSCKKKNIHDNIVVWAIKYQYASNDFFEYPLKFIMPPYHENGNLNSQKGILSYWEINTDIKDINNKYSNVVDRTPLDILIKDYPIIVLYKFKIPSNEAEYIFTYISKLGYTSSRLFPGYDGVVKEIQEETYMHSEFLKNR